MTPSARRGAELVQLRRAEQRRVALVGNPNTGKSTLFNALTGLRQKVANYPGVTVDVHLGSIPLESGWVDLIDLPGMYSLAAHSPDELVGLEVLLGRWSQVPPLDAIIAVVDATNLERNLFLVSQLLELGQPLVVALSMTDLAEAQRVRLDIPRLSEEIGAPVIPVVATPGAGLGALRQAIDGVFGTVAHRDHNLVPAIRQAAQQLGEEIGGDADSVEMMRALIDRRGAVEKALVAANGASLGERLEQIRETVGAGQTLAEIEAEARYGWAAEVVAEVVRMPSRVVALWTDRVDRMVAHPLLGTLIFLGLMATAFQAVFSWATPMVDLIDGLAGQAGDFVRTILPEGALASLIADGLIAGVGAVVVFLPQIIILFLFILILEDSGYMSRAAFMMDRLMRACGLSGQSFIPMLSSFACAVPGILSTRVIPGRRDRLATVLAAPFMTCSARLPVYALLIGAFVPDRTIGFLNIQGLVLFALYILGIVGGVTTALILKRTLLRGPTPTFLIEMPPYRWPSTRSVLLRLRDRVSSFLVRAGTVIFAVSVVVWALVYFPRPAAIGERFDGLRAEASAELDAPVLDERLTTIKNQEASAYLEASILGRLGRFVEPAFKPLGWDWRVSSAVLASFPAREIVLAALGTIYAVGDEVDENDPGLMDRIRGSTWPDGRPVFTLPMALGLMVFFALCLQCGATVAAIRRESGSWRWPIFAWTYMSVLAYVGAFITFRVGTLLLG